MSTAADVMKLIFAVLYALFNNWFYTLL